MHEGIEFDKYRIIASHFIISLSIVTVLPHDRLMI